MHGKVLWQKRTATLIKLSANSSLDMIVKLKRVLYTRCCCRCCCRHRSNSISPNHRDRYGPHFAHDPHQPNANPFCTISTVILGSRPSLHPTVEYPYNAICSILPLVPFKDQTPCAMHQSTIVAGTIYITYMVETTPDD